MTYLFFSSRSTETLGWQWTFYLLAIFATAVLPLVYLMCPETTYIRHNQPKVGSDTAHLTAPGEMQRFGTADWPARYSVRPNKDMSETSFHSKIDTSMDRIETLSFASLDLYGSTPQNRNKATRNDKLITREGLKIFSGRKTDESFFKLLLRPLPLFCHPGILWACLIQGALIGWTVLLGVILAVIMLEPPLSFDEVKTGYMYTGAFVGALVGFVLAGVISDPANKFLSKRNGGIFEPEFRVVLVIPQAIFGAVGLYGFGYSAADTATFGWFWPDFFFGCVCCGMVLGAVASALYIVDAHADIEVEGFTCLLIFKNVLAFALTFNGFQWMTDMGIKPLMIISGSAQIGICALSIPMCKRRPVWCAVRLGKEC